MQFTHFLVGFLSWASFVAAQGLSFNSPSTPQTLTAGNNYGFTLLAASGLHRALLPGQVTDNNMIDTNSQFEQIVVVFSLSLAGPTLGGFAQYDILDVFDVHQPGFFQQSADPEEPGTVHTFFVTIPWSQEPGEYELNIGQLFSTGAGSILSFPASCF